MALEINTKNLIMKIKQSYQEMLDFLNSLNEEEAVKKTNENGWTVKDFVVHVTKWQDGIVNLLQKKDRWVAMGISEETWDTEDDDTINDEIRRNNIDVSFKEVLDNLESSHQSLLKAIYPLPSEALVLPYNHYDTVSDNTRPVVGYIVGNTFGHFGPHLNQMKKIVQS